MDFSMTSSQDLDGSHPPQRQGSAPANDIVPTTPSNYDYLDGRSYDYYDINNTTSRASSIQQQPRTPIKGTSGLDLCKDDPFTNEVHSPRSARHSSGINLVDETPSVRRVGRTANRSLDVVRLRPAATRLEDNLRSDTFHRDDQRTGAYQRALHAFPYPTRSSSLPQHVNTTENPTAQQDVDSLAVTQRNGQIVLLHDPSTVIHTFNQESNTIPAWCPVPQLPLNPWSGGDQFLCFRPQVEQPMSPPRYSRGEILQAYFNSLPDSPPDPEAPDSFEQWCMEGNAVGELEQLEEETWFSNERYARDQRVIQREFQERAELAALAARHAERQRAEEARMRRGGFLRRFFR